MRGSLALLSADARIVGRWLVYVWRDAPGWLLLLLTWSAAAAALSVGFAWLWQFAVDVIGSGAAPRQPFDVVPRDRAHARARGHPSERLHG